MNPTVKAIISGSVLVAAIGAVTAVLIVIVTHGGFTSQNTNALMILVGLITTTGIPSLVTMIKTQQIDTKLTNGLIPQKVTEAMSTNEGQAALTSAIEPIVAKHMDPVVDSLTAPPEETGGTHPIGGSTP